MSDSIDYEKILSQYREDPFGYVDLYSQHTGEIYFHVSPGDEVKGVSGQWHHIPGTHLCDIVRERNVKPILSPSGGVVSYVARDLEGRFIEAGEKIITIRHPLKKMDIIELILREVLVPFKAPERAKYFFSLDIQSRIEKFGQRSVSVKEGDEVFTMSLMKRDTPIYYTGEPGLIHSVYFKPGVTVERDDPLIGVCPPDKLPLIEKIITRVKAEWPA